MSILGDIGGLAGGLLGLGSANSDYSAARSLLSGVNEQAGPSAIESFTEDPNLRAQQMQSLQALRGIADQGGMRPQDIAAQRQAMDESAARARMGDQAVLQNMAQRGMAGSGNELVGRLQVQQNANQRNAQVGQMAAGQANERALRAIQGAGQQAGGLRSQDVGVAGGIASAKDAMAQFNAGQRLNKANAMAGTYTQQAEGSRKSWGNIGSGIGGVGQGAWDTMRAA